MSFEVTTDDEVLIDGGMYKFAYNEHCRVEVERFGQQWVTLTTTSVGHRAMNYLRRLSEGRTVILIHSSDTGLIVSGLYRAIDQLEGRNI